MVRVGGVSFNCLVHVIIDGLISDLAEQNYFLGTGGEAVKHIMVLKLWALEVQTVWIRGCMADVMNAMNAVGGEVLYSVSISCLNQQSLIAVCHGSVM